jgi:hypothetical protein
MDWLTPIIVAVIMGPIVVIMQSIFKLRKENQTQHGEVGKAIERIETKLDNHINWHIGVPNLKRKKPQSKERQNGR